MFAIDTSDINTLKDGSSKYYHARLLNTDDEGGIAAEEDLTWYEDLATDGGESSIVKVMSPMVFPNAARHEL